MKRKNQKFAKLGLALTLIFWAGCTHDRTGETPTPESTSTQAATDIAPSAPETPPESATSTPDSAAQASLPSAAPSLTPEAVPSPVVPGPKSIVESSAEAAAPVTKAISEDQALLEQSGTAIRARESIPSQAEPEAQVTPAKPSKVSRTLKKSKLSIRDAKIGGEISPSSLKPEMLAASSAPATTTPAVANSAEKQTAPSETKPAALPTLAPAPQAPASAPKTDSAATTTRDLAARSKNALEELSAGMSGDEPFYTKKPFMAGMVALLLLGIGVRFALRKSSPQP